MSRKYKVGKGKPPKHSQYKKGQSGNLKGRPKGSRNVHTVLEEIWNGKITVHENGQARRMSFREVFIMKLADKAINGSVNDQLKFLKAMKDYAPELVEHVEKEMQIRVQYVLPDGKTMDDYQDDSVHTPALDSGPPSTEGKDPVDDDPDDDSWLN